MSEFRVVFPQTYLILVLSLSLVHSDAYVALRPEDDHVVDSKQVMASLLYNVFIENYVRSLGRAYFNNRNLYWYL